MRSEENDGTWLRHANADHVNNNGASGSVAKAHLDRLCLAFCISLLDHDLRGDLFESVIVGFLAVMGIDKGKDILKEPYHYTPTLSGFIKVSQLLIIQRAVQAAEDGLVLQPSDLLDEMRERFMTHGTRSPFNWASQLRMYGKRIRDSTTCLGYIDWSDDGERVSYKDVSISMMRLRAFVKDQVAQAQQQLEGLLLLHPMEERESLGLHFQMHRIMDRPVENRRNWSFLNHEGNAKGPLPDRRRWLLERVLYNDWLREEFTSVDTDGPTGIVWRKKAATVYKQRVDAFLERLLLLAHVTSGQPARATELLSLRFQNTVHGHHRNIFVDSGMLSTVTSYHKGYSVTGSTKIIHRYLPNEVGELFVYYLWIVMPFCQSLDLLALGEKGKHSPFVWCKGKTGWDSNRLSAVLRREFGRYFSQQMNIPIYRHLSIAISRKHLPSGGFKRDYGLEDTKFDNQSSHSSWTAGSIYARGLEEAPGHVEARKAVYRQISREWHEFLGFAQSSLPSREALSSLNGQGQFRGKGMNIY